MKTKVGILLGRLTPSKGRGIQFFPDGHGEWQKEFDVAQSLGLTHIEWVWDVPDNPILRADVRSEISSRIRETEIPVRGVDLQFLTKTPIERVSDKLLDKICEAIADINGGTVGPPLLEASSLLDPLKKIKRVERLKVLVEKAREKSLLVNLETDLPPLDVQDLLRDIPDLGITYDSGNSHSMGYAIKEEWEAYGDRIRNVQLKDRPLNGPTVALGEGGTDFRVLFQQISKRGYNGPIALQAARGVDGKEIETVLRYFEFLDSQHE